MALPFFMALHVSPFPAHAECLALPKPLSSARPLAPVVNSSALPSDPSAGRLTPPRLLHVDAPSSLTADGRR